MVKPSCVGRRRIHLHAHVLLTAVLLAILLSSCAKIKVLNTWRDPGYRGQPKKILVHSVGKDPTVRAMLENKLVAQLEAHGVAALAGHEFLPNTLLVNREAIRLSLRLCGFCENDASPVLVRLKKSQFRGYAIAPAFRAAPASGGNSSKHNRDCRERPWASPEQARTACG